MFSVKTFFAVAVAATVASAHITSCGQGQTQACCNPLQGLDLVGADCTDVAVLGGAVQENCGQHVAACCPSDAATGNIIPNLNCLPISG